MRHLQEKNKELEAKYIEISNRYQEMALKDLDNVYCYENTRLKKTLQVVHKKNLKAEEAYQEATKLYQMTRLTAPASSQASEEERAAQKKRIEELEQQNENLSTRLNQAASITTTGHVGSYAISWAWSSVDLHWDDAGELDDMLEDELPYIKEEWRFQREYFKHLPHAARVLSHYKAIIRKLGRYLYPNEEAMIG